MQRQQWTHAITLVCAVLAAVLAHVASAPSVAVTPDSVQYISAAQSIAAGHGVASAVTALESVESRTPLRAWPPLYPALLSLGCRTTESGSHIVDPDWIRAVNLTALLLTFLPLSWLARVIVGDVGWVFVPLWYAAFRPSYFVASFAWSESLFLLLTLTAVALTVRALESERNQLRALLLLRGAGVVAGLAALCRYLGLALIVALAITVVLRSDGIRTRTTLQRLFALIWPALAPIAIWLGRNWIKTGQLTDVPGAPSQRAAGRTLLEGLHTLARDWIAPAAEPSGLAPLVTVLAAAAAFWVIWTLATRFGPDAFEGDPARLTAATALAQYTWIYLAILLGAAIAMPLDPVNTRLLVPIYPGLLLLAAGILRATLQQLRERHALALVAAIAWIATIQAAATAQYLVSPRDTRRETHPYWRTVVWNEARLHDGPSLAILRQLPPESVVITNVWELVTFATGLPVKPWPPEVPPELSPSLAGAYLLWNPAYRSYLPPPARWLESRLPLRLLGEWDGVMLYRIERVTRSGEAGTSSFGSSQWAVRSSEIDS